MDEPPPPLFLEGPFCLCGGSGEVLASLNDLLQRNATTFDGGMISNLEMELRLKPAHGKRFDMSIIGALKAAPGFHAVLADDECSVDFIFHNNTRRRIFYGSGSSSSGSDADGAPQVEREVFMTKRAVGMKLFPWNASGAPLGPDHPDYKRRKVTAQNASSGDHVRATISRETEIGATLEGKVVKVRVRRRTSLAFGAGWRADITLVRTGINVDAAAAAPATVEVEIEAINIQEALADYSTLNNIALVAGQCLVRSH